MTSAAMKCINCGATFEISMVLYHCEKCGDLLDVVYEFTDIATELLKALWQERRKSNNPIDVSGVWRYRELLPFYSNYSNIVTFPEGNTPILDAPRSASYTGLRRLQIKHQGMNPTGSFKDNGMTAAITQAKELGMKVVVCASTGNTSSSVAAYASRANMLAIVIVPDGHIALGKLSQSLDYGALTLQIAGDFDAAQRVVMELAEDLGIYILNSVNPFRIEGQKTIMFELLQQRDWKVPDRIVVPGGNLGNASAFGKGLKEMYDLGFIERIPRLTIIQAQGADPLYRTITGKERDAFITLHPRTLATAIDILDPVNKKKALRALDTTDGWCEEVSEQEIADAKAVIGQDGIGCEPASATTVAGIKKLLTTGTDEKVSPDEDVVAILTGNMLKDPDYTVRYHQGELYEEFVTETSIIMRSGKITSTMANAPVKVEAKKEMIIKIIRDFAARRGIQI